MRILSGTAALFLLLAACSDTGGQPPADAEAEEHAAEGAPAATGRVIEIKAITDDQGNRFEPAAIEAKTGDVLRVTLVSGVHNLHFLADSNPSGVALPPATEMLQLPGQTVDVPVTMPEGDYFFQCDPHAALGMVGRLEVED